MHSQFEFSVDLFYSYSHRDKKYKEKMEESLSLLRDQDKILKTWSDNNILPGQNIPDKIEEKINSTNIIVFLVSQNFIASRECMKEWFRACEIAKKIHHMYVFLLFYQNAHGRTWKVCLH